MTAKAMNFKMDESEITEVRQIASVFNMTLTDVVREALHEYVDRMKADPFYRLTANVENASEEETAEILEELEGLSGTDLEIVSAERVGV